MINPYQQVNWKPGTAELRQFAKSLIVGFPVIAIALLLFGRIFHNSWDSPFALKLGAWGSLAGALFFVIPAVAKPFYFVWYAISCAIGLVLGNVLLGTFYYTLLTAIGLLRRAFGASPVRKSLDRNAATYWSDAPPQPEPSRYFSQS